MTPFSLLARPSSDRQPSSRPALRAIRGVSFLLVTLSIFAAVRAEAYVFSGPKWASGTVTFQMGLGNAGRTLIDGNTSWDTAALPALSAWNAQVGRVQLRGVVNPSAPVSKSDRVNSIVFSNSVFGQSFGSSTLAVTYYTYSSSGYTEADVLFNRNAKFDSYRGPLRFGSDGRAVADLPRVLIHELGHAIGLNHPDGKGQHVDAIMNSVVGDRELPSSDDVAGARALYGAPTATAGPRVIAVSAAPRAIKNGGRTYFAIKSMNGPAAVRTVIRYSISGSAVRGTNYTLYGAGAVALLPGATTAYVRMDGFGVDATAKTVTLTVQANWAYAISPTWSRATVTISR